MNMAAHTRIGFVPCPSLATYSYRSMAFQSPLRSQLEYNRHDRMRLLFRKHFLGGDHVKITGYKKRNQEETSSDRQGKKKIQTGKKTIGLSF
jgi:hypothetical protein